MENYIKVDRIEKELDFVNLVITTTNIDTKNEDDLFKTFSKDEFNLTNLTRNSQIHSSIVNKIDEKNIGQRIDGDALISNVKEVPLLILTADCVPVVIIDPKNKAVGVAHAGLRGTYDKICKNTFKSKSEIDSIFKGLPDTEIPDEYKPELKLFDIAISIVNLTLDSSIPVSSSVITK